MSKKIKSAELQRPDARHEEMLKQFTTEEVETAHDIANDIAEDIDRPGESKARLRRTIQYFAMLSHYERQESAALESRLRIAQVAVGLLNEAIKPANLGRLASKRTNR